MWTLQPRGSAAGLPASRRSDPLQGSCARRSMDLPMSQLASSLADRLKDGYRAFQVPLPPVVGRNQGQAFDKSVKARMDSLRASAPPSANFAAAGRELHAGDAASVAASLERFHLLWFDEPCPAGNLRTIRKLADESVTPLGFRLGRFQPTVFQELLREGLVDVLRPELQAHPWRERHPPDRGVGRDLRCSRVAPRHEGGPIGTAVALQLAASLPNFFIQHIPCPIDERDRHMRLGTGISTRSRHDGFAALPTGRGLGIEVNETALEKYKETAA